MSTSEFTDNIRKFPHFTEKEKWLLSKLVEKFKDILENKRNDATTVQRKKETWEQIALEFNYKATIMRNSNQLRKLWNNMKQRKRMEITKEKYKRLLAEKMSTPNSPIIEAVNVPPAVPHIDNISLACGWDPNEGFDMKNTDEIKIESDSISLISENEMQDTISLSADSPSEPTYLNKDDLCTVDETESNLRIKKLKLAIKQQNEYHALRMETEKILKRKAEVELQWAEIQLKKLKSETEY